MPDVVAKWFLGGERKISVDRAPDWCTICHRYVSPRILFGAMVDNPDQDYAQIIFRCTSESCQEVFIGTYRQHGRGQNYTLTDLAPKKVKKPQFSDVICELSPPFGDQWRGGCCGSDRPRSA